jgi:hypothetical protein
VSRNWTTWAAVEYDCVLVREAALGRQIAD